MRIISGKHKGRRLVAPKNLPVRPTTDMCKESLFNILNNYFNFHGLKVLDLFSGTGNISYEFGSRGAGPITSVDGDFGCVNFIKKTKNPQEKRSEPNSLYIINLFSNILTHVHPPECQIDSIPHNAFLNGNTMFIVFLHWREH